MSGWPKGLFHRPEEFGSLIFNSYSANIERSIGNLKNEVKKNKSYVSDTIKIETLTAIENKLDNIKKENSPSLPKEEWYFLNKDIEFISRQIRSIGMKQAMKEFSEKLNEVKTGRKQLTQQEKEKLGAELTGLKEIAEALSAADREIFRKAQGEYWQMLFPENGYLCWAKNPWMNLLPHDFPSPSIKKCQEL